MEEKEKTDREIHRENANTIFFPCNAIPSLPLLIPGEHPRMGALDVCPFIPVRGVSVEECVGVAKVFGQRLAEEVGVPVFLYGAASTRDYRKTMPQIRAGEYEGLKEKVKEQILVAKFIFFIRHSDAYCWIL